MERSSSAALAAAPSAASVIFSAFWATPTTERAICSMAVATRSTSADRLSEVAPTSSIEAAVSLIEVAVVSAATSNSSLVLDRPCSERDISSIDAALSFTAVIRLSVFSLTLFTDAAICVAEVATCVVEVTVSWICALTLRVAADVSSTAALISFMAPASAPALPLTCSVDAAISFIDDTSCSAEPPTEAVCMAVSFSAAAVSFTCLTSPSNERTCCTLPSCKVWAIRVNSAVSAADWDAPAGCCRPLSTAGGIFGREAMV